MDPGGRFIHGSMAADKHSPKDTRHFMNLINLMNLINFFLSLSP